MTVIEVQMQRLWRSVGLLAIAVCSVGLAGCQRGAVWGGALWGGANGTRGRYVGVGIYTPTAEWRMLIGKEQPSSPAAAQRQDDQVILVTADSTTGELRACGDLSGYCVGFNPWKAPLGALQTAPVPVATHGLGNSTVANTADSAAAAASSDVNVAEPSR